MSVQRPGILVVEDDFLLALAVEDVLTDMGCRPLGPAPSVSKALAVIEDETPAGALLDINLTKEQSFPIADALAEKGVPFIFTTAYNGSMLPERFSNCPHIKKPFTPSAISQMIQDVFGVPEDRADPA